ncbi:MAG: CcmD family protein [Sediminibacterium sp.]|nr:CcmD family protein [Sediminibacterium sp.]
MNKVNRIIFVLMLAMFTAVAQAQTTDADTAGVMRSNGKIYVVVAIVITILLGLFFYVFSLDRKISKLEKK